MIFWEQFSKLIWLFFILLFLLLSLYIFLLRAIEQQQSVAALLWQAFESAPITFYFTFTFYSCFPVTEQQHNSRCHNVTDLWAAARRAFSLLLFTFPFHFPFSFSLFTYIFTFTFHLFSQSHGATAQQKLRLQTLKPDICSFHFHFFYPVTEQQHSSRCHIVTDLWTVARRAFSQWKTLKAKLSQFAQSQPLPSQL